MKINLNKTWFAFDSIWSSWTGTTIWTTSWDIIN